MGGMWKDTTRVCARRITTPPTHNRGTSNRRHPLQVARDIRIARQVRPLVGWTQREGLRRLAFALRPLIDEGMDVHDIAAELHSWHLTWRPERPAAYITASLRRQAEQQALEPDPVLPTPAENADAVAPQCNEAWRKWREQEHAKNALEKLLATAPRTDEDRRIARARARLNPRLVLEHRDEYGEDDALDLYGPELAARAARLDASTNITLGAF